MPRIFPKVNVYYYLVTVDIIYKHSSDRFKFINYIIFLVLVFNYQQLKPENF